MSPPSSRPDTWRHEALQGVSALAKSDHNRLRKDLTVEILERKQEHKELEQRFDALREELKRDYTQKIEFSPLQRGFYGLITVILTGVIIALLKIIGISK